MDTAKDSFLVMAHFLSMEEHPRFTDNDYEQLKLRCKTLAEAVAQMDGGQKGKGVNFNELDHVFINIAVLAMKLVMSERLEDESNDYPGSK